MSYIPLNNKNFEVGDNVTCIENRFARKFDYTTGFKEFGFETVHFLTLTKEYQVVKKDTTRRKVAIITDDGVERQIPYYRLGVKDELN